MINPRRCGEWRLLELLGAGENVAFVIALAIMALLGLVEAIGLGTGLVGDGHLHFDADTDWLGWLGFGRLPVSMLLVLFRSRRCWAATTCPASSLRR